MKEALLIVENIKRLRKQKGWSQADLAEKTQSTLSHINKLETGKYLPSLDNLIKIANAFDVSLDYLVSEEVGNYEEVNTDGKSFFQKLKLIDTLDLEDKKALTRIIDSMLTKKKILNLVANNQEIEKS
ncbi:helix-turn-helix domain-containing protein [Leptospira interrogans]|uniref:Helix-turn-helix transcriptional regulator n=2 Tax=Leptospira interrogans TaxID=173 RepID=A0AAV9FQ34_LEPIR|nr:helix-turn-helix transcriptional regulator [Leptospira interrogans]EMM79346.1 DNA-binding helix-turn-helix protein [Leptospira interrogans str. 2006001854]EMN56179.1 DNA-binding helix-turn-helix protein [Leptospira interrogans serovar Autumnalis str. LP101]KAK2617177.1 helix-turn-helix transcriptional regulator [Leptospira interrogans]UMQ57695.1 helix-turn-helix domain-containing protein [Leptospira interrogans]UMQ57713.1 helix-turn-helix domain-containing protein [Leptospira interrogans]